MKRHSVMDFELLVTPADFTYRVGFEKLLPDCWPFHGSLGPSRDLASDSIFDVPNETHSAIVNPF